MTQDEKWLARFKEVKAFIEKNHCNPSKYNPEERLLIHFLKRNRKLINAGDFKEPRLGKFQEMMELSENFKHVNP